MAYECGENDWTIVKINGEADVYAVPQIRGHAVGRIREGRRRFIIDLRGASFMDSTGLGVLVGIRKRLHTRVGELRLVIANPNIRRIFTVTGPHVIFPIYDSLVAHGA
ncbi:STAS domain-containing protein [Streptomyces brasiliensis]|uniref:Anti-sigma factor antagonist n=1 Tax=Streptomyces brasiliensis TaxID=1954 RepID=A0A917P4N1_9ACTN|nr:STAS domain-containing protein [Streptomyces brasiliensis]GGJ61515.1 anti-sigma factor antagonist [Streptomyces brasiliensis]